MIDTNRYEPLQSTRLSYIGLILLSLLVILVASYCAVQLEHSGHIISGMNNHVVWGLPHVFAVSLIVCASGALNGASFSSVFGLTLYKPIARFSVVLSMCLLLGGLVVLVLDLGRPDRLIIAMTTFNFKSIFAWNIFLYNGFLIVCAVYLWMMMEKRFNRHTSRVGKVALAWRLILTTGTGCIFGFLVGRNSLDSALLAPMFIALSLVMGLSVYGLMLVLINRWRNGLLSNSILQSMNRFLFWFLIAILYFSIVRHVSNLYVSEHRAVEHFVLLGDFSPIFWLGHIFVGVLVPMIVLSSSRLALPVSVKFVLSSTMSLLGGMALLYVVIIGSQSTPQVLFPGKTILNSQFGDAGFPVYEPTLWELGLGAGGVFFAVLLCIVTIRILPIIPESSNEVRSEST